MFFDGEYRKIGDCDPAVMHSLVSALPEESWFEEVGRQQVYAPHRQTHTIPLIFDPDMRHDRATIRPRYADFRPGLEPIMARIADFYGDLAPPGADLRKAYFQRAILVRLVAGANIGTHHDEGASLSRSHRIHFPILTNPKTEVGIAGHIRHLRAGEIWEINNRKIHAVRNLGSSDRVHLILDYVLPGEVVADPAGTLIA